MLLAVFSFVAFYAIWMILATPGTTRPETRRLRVMGRFAAAVALSLGLVAFYFLPILYLLTDLPRQVSATYHNYGLAFVPPIGLYQLISPTLFDGFKVFADPAMKGVVEPWQILPYVGILPILAALLASRATRAGQGPLLTLTLWATVLVALKVVGAEPILWISFLPGLNNLRWVPYAGVLFNSFFAILGALGLESLLAGKVRPARAWIVLLSGLVLLLSLRQIAKLNGLLAHFHAFHWLKDWRFVFALALSFSGLVAVGVWMRSRPMVGRILVVLTVGLCILEGVSNTFYPRQKAWDVWRHPVPYVEKLIANSGSARVLASGALLSANSASAFEIFGVKSLSAFNSGRVFSLYRQYFSPDVTLFLNYPTQLPPESVLDHANVELLAVSSYQAEIRQELDQRGHEILSDEGSVRIYRRPTPSRYYFSSAYRVMEPRAALEAIGTRGSEREVILEKPPSFGSQPNRAGEPSVAVREFRRNGYTLEIEAPRPGLIYCSESFFRGWTARVNGERAEILRANYAFRAIEVPAGPAVIELEYWPPGLTWGLVITSLSLILAMVGFWRKSRSY